MMEEETTPGDSRSGVEWLGLDCASSGTTSASTFGISFDRPEEMEKLEFALLQTNEAEKCRQVVLYGPEDSGKTHLARAFIRRHQSMYSKVSWINCATNYAIKRDIAAITKEIPYGQIPDTSSLYISRIEVESEDESPGESEDEFDEEDDDELYNVVRDVIEWLATGENKPLIIFDNLTSITSTLLLENFIPEVGDISILITTRSPDLKRLGISIELHEYNEDLACQLIALAHRLLDKGNLDEAERVYKGTIERSQKAVGTRGQLAVTAMNELGDLYVSQGKLAEAQRMYDTELDVTEQTLDDSGENLTVDKMLYSANRLINTPLLATLMRAIAGASEAEEENMDSERLSDLDIIQYMGIKHKNGRKLCLNCRELTFEGMTRSSQIQHHTSYGDLLYSARIGCKLCLLLTRSLVHSYCRKLSWSTKEVHEYHRQQDERDLNEDDPDKISRFYIEPLYGEIDCRFTTSRQGIFGVLFVRRIPDGIPLKEVFPFWKFEAHPGTTAVLNGYIIGRGIRQLPDISLGREWIDDCMASHTDCVQPQESHLPSRIIDVGPNDGTNRLRLMHSEGQKGVYITLSHCWGTVSGRLVTNLTNYQQHLLGISFDDLPRTFQDAVTVTRELGVRFLWIDCLCIIQDSVEDWQRECARMGQIYKDSLVTIAGPGAADSCAGFLHERPASNFPILRFELRCHMGDGESTGYIDLAYHGCDAFPQHPFESESPPAKRGWIFQERMLSCRILYFGSEKMYFECCTNIRHEDSYAPCVHSGETKMVKKEPLTELGKFSRSKWQSILRYYTALRLTKPTDKLPALSGLVSATQRNLGDRYLAGIWESQLHTGLSWYIETKDLRSKIASRESTYIAPSWSWASVESPISTFPTREGIQPLDKALTILDVQVELAGHDPFGELRSGYLKARGKLKMGIIRNLPLGKFLLLTDGPTEIRDMVLIARYYPDDPEMALFPPFPVPRQPRIRTPDISMFERRVFLLLLGSIESLPTADIPSSEGWLGLAVEPVPGTNNSYRRIGIAEAIFSQFSDARTWFDESEETVVEII